MPIASTVPTASPYLQTIADPDGLVREQAQAPDQILDGRLRGQGDGQSPDAQPGDDSIHRHPQPVRTHREQRHADDDSQQTGADADEMGVDALGRDCRRGDDRFGDHWCEAPRHPCAGEEHDRGRCEFDRAAQGTDHVELIERQVGRRWRRGENRGRQSELRQCP